MRVALGTKNEAKTKACISVFERAFPGEHIDVSGYSVESGVSDMPMSNDETYEGALNRALELTLLDSSADYYVGLEGGVQEGPKGRLYLLGWAAIIKAGSDLDYAGHSGGIELPDEIADKLREGAELGPLIQEMTGDEKNEIRHTLGTNGLLTNGLYSRDKEFEDAIACALGISLSAENTK
jgi:inosine/xanthosine triphosphatase